MGTTNNLNEMVKPRKSFGMAMMVELGEIEAHKILWLCTHKIGRGSSKEVMREILNSLQSLN